MYMLSQIASTKPAVHLGIDGVMHGRFVDAAYRSAKAWAGDWNSPSPEVWDEQIWARMQAEDPVIQDDEAVLVHQAGSFDVFEVDFTLTRSFDDEWSRTRSLEDWCMRNFLDGFDPKSVYPSIDSRRFRRTAHLFVCTWVDREEADLLSALGQPHCDGFLAALSVLCDTDRLLPLKIQWVGRNIDELELSRRVEQFLAWSQTVQARPPKVPCPVLPPDVLDLIEVSRSGAATLSEKERLVERMMQLDRVSFLETVDRLWPWVVWHNAPAAWVDKNDQICDRLWQIITELDELSRPGVLRLAPWKTGLGQPKDIEFQVGSATRLRGNYRVVVRRTFSGTYRVNH